MKFTINIKDPDGFDEGIKEAAKRSMKNNNTSSSESDILLEIRQREIEETISEWVRYGECIDVEFDTEKRTATVLKK